MPGAPRERPLRRRGLCSEYQRPAKPVHQSRRQVRVGREERGSVRPDSAQPLFASTVRTRQLAHGPKRVRDLRCSRPARPRGCRASLWLRRPVVRHDSRATARSAPPRGRWTIPRPRSPPASHRTKRRRAPSHRGGCCRGPTSHSTAARTSPAIGPNAAPLPPEFPCPRRSIARTVIPASCSRAATAAHSSFDRPSMWTSTTPGPGRPVSYKRAGERRPIRGSPRDVAARGGQRLNADDCAQGEHNRGRRAHPTHLSPPSASR